MSRFYDNRLSRREWLKMSAAGVTVGSMSGWLETLAADVAKNKDRKRSCILLWMTGGPTQTDTFDMKPDHANGGEFKPIKTKVPGIEISEHLPTLAKQMEHIVPIRSMTSKEGDHERATFYLRTGYRPQGPVHYPSIGSLISHELGESSSESPKLCKHLAVPGVQPRGVRTGLFGAAVRAVGHRRIPLRFAGSERLRQEPSGRKHAAARKRPIRPGRCKAADARRNGSRFRRLPARFDHKQPSNRLPASRANDALRSRQSLRTG